MLKRLSLVVILSAFATPAGAEEVSSAGDSNLMVGIIVAVITGLLSAIATGFVTDRFTRSTEQRQKKATQDEIVRNYLGPLAKATERMVWRLSEPFDSRRAQWGEADGSHDFTEYKRQSTLYRIATLLGWIRAIDLELGALPPTSAITETPLSTAMEDVRKALADGSRVEERRLTALCKLWNLDVTKEDARFPTRLEIELYRQDPGSRADPLSILHADPERKLKICIALNAWLSAELGKQPLASDIIARGLDDAIAALPYRETLIYHDWQDAIADAVLKSDADSVRHFQIIGFDKFVKLLSSDKPWFRALRELVDHLDFEHVAANDCRVEVLEKLSKRVSVLLLAIADREPGLIDPDMLKVARKLSGQLPVEV